MEEEITSLPIHPMLITKTSSGKVKDRKMTAMMVMGNIETFANHLDQCANHMYWNDTLATYLLAIPVDSLDFVDQGLHPLEE